MKNKIDRIIKLLSEVDNEASVHVKLWYENQAGITIKESKKVLEELKQSVVHSDA